jgi:hypothetical protein
MPTTTRWFAALDTAARPGAEARSTAELPSASGGLPVQPVAGATGVSLSPSLAGATGPQAWWAMALALPSLVTMFAAPGWPLRVLAGVGALVAIALFARWGRARGDVAEATAEASPTPPPDAPSGRGIALSGERLAFVPRRDPSAPTTERDLLLLDAPFGVTLLASPRRDQLIALLSSAAGTFYLGAAFDASARRAFAPLLERCFTVVGDDVGMAAIGPDGEPLVLAPDELASLLDALLEASPSCLEGFVATDARGAPVTLDGRHLRVGERAVDLGAPLEWKPIVFQEAFGHAVAVYQGTWIRQSSTELTLVSLLPALGPAPGADIDLTAVDRGVLRDLRLMQASPESPPPNEQRVAIDRLFMLPVRSALDGAPRVTRDEHPARA